MDKRTNRILDSGQRSLQFAQANPDDHPVITATVQELVTLMTRADALSTQVEAGHKDASASTRGKARVRSGIHEDLALLQPFAALATTRQPDTLLKFELSPLSVSRVRFIAATHAILDRATRHQELLTSLGAPADLVPRVAEALATYEATDTVKETAAQRRIGARAELRELSRQLRVTIQYLGALYRVRFKGNAEKLAAWSSASSMHGPMPAPKPEDGKAA